MYIVRWLKGHPILATWFLGAIAILMSIGNHGAKKELHVEAHTGNQDQVVDTHSTKSLDKPSTVTSALIESDKKKVIIKKEVIEEPVKKAIAETKSVESVNTNVADVKITDTKKIASVKAEKLPAVTDGKTLITNTNNVVVENNNKEVATEKTGGSAIISYQSPSDSLPENTEAPVTEEVKGISQSAVEGVAAKPEDQTSTTSNIATTAELITEEIPKPKSAPAGSESIQDLSHLSPEEMLVMAREAYWNNGLEEASQIYTQLIELQPDVIEYRGELGNVYWRQGYPKKAAQLYSEIAIPMIEQGNSERVANMVGFIGLFYPDRAAEIHKRLQAVNTKSND